MIPALVMTLALFGLAGARIAPLRRNGKDNVFVAAMFAGISCLLQIPPVYVAVDSLLGGVNITKLLLNCSMVAGLWYLRAAVLSAMSPEPDTRPVWRRTLPLSVNIALQPVFFFLAGLVPTRPSWSGELPNRIAGILFSELTLFFIAWTCGSVALACFRYVPRMRQSFRVGFSMVGLGCVLAVLVMVNMILGGLTSAFPSIVFDLRIPEHEIEMAAIVLVGVGLTIPPVAGRYRRRRADRRLTRAIAEVSSIREKALKDAPVERSLRMTEYATPQEHLHRMIVEIWDAELAAGPANSVLSPADRNYMILVESDLGRLS